MIHPYDETVFILMKNGVLIPATLWMNLFFIYNLFVLLKDNCFTTMWMNLENMMLSERSQTQSHILCDSIYTKYPE